MRQLPDDMPVTVISPWGDAVHREPGGEWQDINDPWRSDLFGPETVDNARVLVFTPAHPTYGIRPATLASIRAAIDAYDGPADWLISTGDNPYSHPYENVTYQHNKARLAALQGEYDALLSIEADMVVPEDAISALLSVDADIVYGLYVWRHRMKNGAHRWSAYTTVALFGGESISLSPNEARAAWGKVIKVAGLGMGCTLLRRSALGQIKFRLYEGKQGDWLHGAYGEQAERLGIQLGRSHKSVFCDDWMLALDAKHFGLDQRCNTAVVCGHIDTDGGVLWPDPTAEMLYVREPFSNGARERRGE